MGRPTTDMRAVLSLILGLISFVGPGLLAGIPAWILGAAVMNERSADDPSYVYARIGRICGMISVVWTVFIVWFVGSMIFRYGLPAQL